MKNYSNNLLIASFLFILFFQAAFLPGFCEAINDTGVSVPDKGILGSLLGPKDDRPPQVELQDIADGQRVYTEYIYIAGSAVDANEIEALTLNNRSVLDSSGRNISFSLLEKLGEGENLITIEAVDDAGNKTKKEITVIREKLSLSQLPQGVFDKRMRIAVYPFEENGDVSERSAFFMDLLMLALQGQKRFRITDRDLLEKILEEQKLGLTQLIDQKAALNMGRIMSAQAIITGSIIETGSGIEVVGRVIDTETSAVIATEKIYSAANGLQALNFLAEAMAVQLTNDFPMLRGMVIKRSGGLIITDLGGGSVPPHGRLIVYRNNDATSLVLGYARITQVHPDMSRAELVKGRLDEIRVLDSVVLQ